MSRLVLLTLLALFWAVLAVIQFVTGPWWLGAGFLLVAALQAVTIVHERGCQARQASLPGRQ